MFPPMCPRPTKPIVDMASTPDGRGYAYTYQRRLDDLYLVEGLE